MHGCTRGRRGGETDVSLDPRVGGLLPAVHGHGVDDRDVVDLGVVGGQHASRSRVEGAVAGVAPVRRQRLVLGGAQEPHESLGLLDQCGRPLLRVVLGPQPQLRVRHLVWPRLQRVVERDCDVLALDRDAVLAAVVLAVADVREVEGLRGHGALRGPLLAVVVHQEAVAHLWCSGAQRGAAGWRRGAAARPRRAGRSWWPHLRACAGQTAERRGRAAGPSGRAERPGGRPHWPQTTSPWHRPPCRGLSTCGARCPGWEPGQSPRAP